MYCGENNSVSEYMNIPIPIVTALIGVFSALVVQGLFFLIRTTQENNRKSKELFAEIESYSFLLRKFYKELVMHKVHKHYWFKASVLENDSKYENIYYNNHLESNQSAFAVENKINQTFSSYTKALRSYLFIKGKNKTIDEYLNKYKNFEPRKSSEFEGVPFDKLREYEIKEENDLNEIYSKFGEYLEEINKLLDK